MSTKTFPDEIAKERLGVLASQGVHHPLHSKGFLIDVDGVICRGMELITGADVVLEKLRDGNKKTIFVSNNSTKSPKLYRKKLLQLGINVEKDELVLATVAAAEYIRNKHPNALVYVVGDVGLEETLLEYDLKPTEKPGEANFVVVGNPFARNGKLRKNNDGKITGAVRAILEGGAEFVAVNADTIFPTEEGPVPATGAIVKAIAHATGSSPDLVAGKPRGQITSLALERLNLSPDECALIGDSKVDMIAARNAGLKSIFVRTGAGREKELEKDNIYPDFTLDSIRDILKVDDF